MTKEEITYEVLGYFSQYDFDERNFIIIEEFIPTKKEALEIGEESLELYEIVKVQSNDREEIEILRLSDEF